MARKAPAPSADHLVKLAARLRLTKMREEINEMLAIANDAKMNPRETLEYFLGCEAETREKNRTRIAMMGAHFPKVCTLEDFDFQLQPSLDPAVIRDLAALDWCKGGENIIFMGPPGVGKTHLAIALGRLAVMAGESVLFLSALNLAQQLYKAQKEDAISQKLTALCKPGVLIIDEFGYVPTSETIGHLFFQLVERRYEHKSIIITSNRPPSEWGLVLGDRQAAAAAIDRLIHHSTIVSIQGESYRLKSKKMAKIKPAFKEETAPA